MTGIREALKDSDYILNEELEAADESWLLENPFDTGVGWASEPTWTAAAVTRGEYLRGAASICRYLLRTQG